MAQIDAMSRGRAQLGIGWPELRERFDRYEEQHEIVTGHWATPLGATYTFTGRHYQVADPLQRR